MHCQSVSQSLSPALLLLLHPGKYLRIEEGKGRFLWSTLNIPKYVMCMQMFHPIESFANVCKVILASNRKLLLFRPSMLESSSSSFGKCVSSFVFQSFHFSSTLPLWLLPLCSSKDVDRYADMLLRSIITSTVICLSSIKVVSDEMEFRADIIIVINFTPDWHSHAIWKLLLKPRALIFDFASTPKSQSLRGPSYYEHQLSSQANWETREWTMPLVQKIRLMILWNFSVNAIIMYSIWVLAAGSWLAPKGPPSFIPVLVIIICLTGGEASSWAPCVCVIY